VLYNCKGRKAANIGSEYHIWLYHSPKNLKFDPVTWIIKEWRSRSKADLEKPDAQILYPLSAKTWNEHLGDYIFGPMGHPCTSHSICRLAAQWAGRCGSDLSVIQNVGRWECLNELLKYVAEGNEQGIVMKRDHGTDPIFDFWPFFPNTLVSSMSTTRTQFAGMRGGRANIINFT
jgi:hypothetical protein